MVFINVMVQVSELEHPCGRFGMSVSIFCRCLIRLQSHWQCQGIRGKVLVYQNNSFL